MDMCSECLVRKRPSSKESALRSLCLGVITFLEFFFIVATIMINQMFILAFLVLTVLLVTDYYYTRKIIPKLSNCIEYEYIQVNSSVDIDKIVARQDRSRMISFDTKAVTLFSPLDLATDTELDPSKYDTIVDSSVCNYDSDTCIIILDHEKYGKTLIYFTPDEEFTKLFATTVASRARKAQ